MSWRARLSTNMLQLRFAFDPHSQASEGTRNFISNNYSELKRLNPKLPFLVRPSDNMKARVIATYDYGGTAERELEDLTEKQISEKIQELNLVGQHALRATHYPWQAGVVQDESSIAFEDIPAYYRF